MSAPSKPSVQEHDSETLHGVQALLFDVFGTVVDWHGSVTAELRTLGAKHGMEDADWDEFARTWRQGYMQTTKRVAAGGPGTRDVDLMHREILENLLSTPAWRKLGDRLDKGARDALNLVWHRLYGWSDSTPGLYALKKQLLICTLSNGTVRLLADMAKFADLPWDVVFSADMFDSFKPDPQVYLGAARKLSLEPHQCAMVAAHIYDLRAAAALGMCTVYIPRGDDGEGLEAGVKAKAEGGEVDVVVRSFEDLAAVLAARQQ
ncbi:unnamed protein product [Mycena citricolor]|uniref:Haloacid dehalogenase n=1 Tax=Mycena citricolor TaxID=2018698 RepID=A0AAD2HI90_9AGAR|nr:unnamed protein product [Mycena citricolor]